MDGGVSVKTDVRCAGLHIPLSFITHYRYAAMWILCCNGWILMIHLMSDFSMSTKCFIPSIYSILSICVSQYLLCGYECRCTHEYSNLNSLLVPLSKCLSACKCKSLQMCCGNTTKQFATSCPESAMWLTVSTTDTVPSVLCCVWCRIPGRLNDRRTPLGELNWIFTAITDTIAWNVLPRGEALHTQTHDRDARFNLFNQITTFYCPLPPVPTLTESTQFITTWVSSFHYIVMKYLHSSKSLVIHLKRGLKER